MTILSASVAGLQFIVLTYCFAGGRHKFMYLIHSGPFNISLSVTDVNLCVKYRLNLIIIKFL